MVFIHYSRVCFGTCISVYSPQTIPSEIGKLTSLQSLDLSLNGLSGYIPDEIFELSSLVKLDVGYQSLGNFNLTAWNCIRSDGTVADMEYSKGDPENDDNIGLEGQILGSESIKKLRYLNEISISSNSFSGVGFVLPIAVLCYETVGIISMYLLAACGLIISMLKLFFAKICPKYLILCF